MLLGQRNYQEGEQQDDGVEPAVEKRVNGIKRKQEKLKERQEFAKTKGNWHRSDSKQELVMEEGSWRAQGRTSNCRLKGLRGAYWSKSKSKTMEPSSSREEGPMKSENERETLRAKLKEARNAWGVVPTNGNTPSLE